MNWNKLFKMQNQLDHHIYEKFGVTSETISTKKTLALLVELAETAQETRCFKYWSEKPSKPREVILGELVDVLHFIISKGLEMDVKELPTGTIKHDDLSTHFVYLFNAITTLELSHKPNYSQVFSSFLGLVEELGFTQEELEQGYYIKNEINYERQAEGY